VKEWFFILLTVFSSSAGDILCAKGMSEGESLEHVDASGLGHALRVIVADRYVILGWVCYAVAFFSMMGLLSVAQLSVAVPATALSFVIDTLGARFLLHEHVPWRRWVGVVCVSAGVVLAVKPAAHAGAPVPVLAGAAGANRAAVESCQDQARNHQAGSHDLHHQGAPCKVLAKP
jgi:multidrug transporter EmrE-like cation transporter